MADSRELSLILRLKDEVSKELAVVGTKLEGMKPTLNKVAIASGAAFGALSLGILKSSTDFSTFDTQIQKAGANVQATDDIIAKFRETAIKAAKGTTISFTESAHALSFLAGGSITAQDAMDSLSDTLKFSAANNIDVEKSAIVASQAMSLFKVRGDQLTDTLDLLTRAGQISFAKTDQLADSFAEAGPIAAQLGISLIDLTSVIGAMGDVGFIGTEAGVALKRAFTELLNPSKAMEEGFHAIGVSADEMQKLLKDPIALVGKLEEKFGDITDPIERASALAKVFGQVSGPAMASLVGLGADSIQKYKDQLEGAGGTLQTTVDRVNNAISPFTLFKQNLDEISIKLGTGLNPQLREMFAAIQPVIDKVIEFITLHPQLSAGILLTVTAIAGLTFALSSLGLIIIAITPAITAIGTVIGLISLPMLAIIALIGIIVAVVAWWVINWKENMETIKWAFNIVKDKIIEIWEDIKKAFKGAYDYISKNVFDPILRWINKIIDAVARAREAIKSIGGKVGGAVSNVGNFLIDTVGGGINKALGINDGVIAPDGQIVSTHPDDWLIATKDPKSLGGRGGINITITGNTFMSDREASEKIGNMIIKTLGLNAIIG